jgi:formylglycine-generating enzyme required for sulfatase activity
MTTAVDAIPPERFPPRLTQLGFTGHVLSGIEIILSPLCAVPAGTFLMGSDPTLDALAQPHEQPQHPVVVADFRVAMFPVTVAEYACFVRSGGRTPPPYPYQDKVVDWPSQLRQPDHPVVCVSWGEARAYAGWLADTTGEPWRLATEAEWEKAARWDPTARHARLYPWGDRFEPWRCNSQGSIGTTTPVGSYAAGASPCGAQEMAGNVCEWTSSRYRPYPYVVDDGRENPEALDRHVLRGSTWGSNAAVARAAVRDYSGYPGGFFGSLGFRLVCTAPWLNTTLRAGFWLLF